MKYWKYRVNFYFQYSEKIKYRAKYWQKYFSQKCSFVKNHQFKLNYLLIIIKFRVCSNTLLKIFIRLQIMGSLQDENQNSENQGMTQGAPVNKCITIHQNRDNYNQGHPCVHTRLILAPDIGMMNMWNYTTIYIFG